MFTNPDNIAQLIKWRNSNTLPKDKTTIIRTEVLNKKDCNYIGKVQRRSLGLVTKRMKIRKIKSRFWKYILLKSIFNKLARHRIKEKLISLHYSHGCGILTKLLICFIIAYKMWTCTTSRLRHSVSHQIPKTRMIMTTQNFFPKKYLYTLS